MNSANPTPHALATSTLASQPAVAPDWIQDSDEHTNLALPHHNLRSCLRDASLRAAEWLIGEEGRAIPDGVVTWGVPSVLLPESVPQGGDRPVSTDSPRAKPEVLILRLALRPSDLLGTRPTVGLRLTEGESGRDSPWAIIEDMAPARLFLIDRQPTRWESLTPLSPLLLDLAPALDATLVLRTVHFETRYRLRRQELFKRRNAEIRLAELTRMGSERDAAAI